MLELDQFFSAEIMGWMIFSFEEILDIFLTDF